MPANNRRQERQLELFLERIFSQVKFPGHSDDEVFLEGFYQKLREGVRFEPQTLGAWCWRLAPVTGIASFLLCLTLVAGHQFDRAAGPEGEDDVVALLSESPEGDAIVESILHAEGGE